MTLRILFKSHVTAKTMTKKKSPHTVGIPINSTDCVTERDVVMFDAVGGTVLIVELLVLLVLMLLVAVDTPGATLLNKSFGLLLLAVNEKLHRLYI